jgi:hypothetical protein
VNADLVQTDGDEDQRRAEDLRQVNLRPAAALPGEQDLPANARSNARRPAATASEPIGEKEGRTPGPPTVTTTSSPDLTRKLGLEGENRGAGMIVTLTRGSGEVFNGGSTEWPYALSTGDPFVTQVARNVLDRYLAKL